LISGALSKKDATELGLKYEGNIYSSIAFSISFFLIKLSSNGI